MDADRWPREEPARLEELSAPALVGRVLTDVDRSSDTQRDALLCNLLCAAWGSVLAQNQ